MSRLLPLIAFVLLAALLFVGVRMNSGKDNSAIPSPLIGKPAPVLALPELPLPESRVAIDALRGRAYVLNVWGSWCVSCRVEHPVITELAGSGALVVGYNYKDTPEDASRWLAQYGNPFALVVQDADGQAALLLELADQFVQQLQVRHAGGLGHRDAVDVRADRRFDVANRQRQRLVDAHHHVGTAAFDARGIFLHQLACSGFFRGRHAVLDVELDHVGAAGVRLVNVFLNVDGYIHQRTPDGEFTVHG